MEYGNFNDLKAVGLRVSKGLDTRGKDIPVRFEAPSQISNAGLFLYNPISIGMYSYSRTGTLRYLESIGRYVSIGPNVMIGEAEHPTNWLSTSSAQYGPEQFAFYPPEKELAKRRRIARKPGNHDGATGNVRIGNDVWIGGGAQIRRGVAIGDGAIIAGGAFVSRDVEPYSFVGGIPAKVIRKRFPEKIIAELLDLRWWRFDINDLAGVDFSKIDLAIRQIRELEKNGKIRECPVNYSEVLLNSKGYTGLKDNRVSA